MPTRLLRNGSLVAAMTITFLYMATFGALPYFPTVLFQTLRGFGAAGDGPRLPRPFITGHRRSASQPRRSGWPRA